MQRDGAALNMVLRILQRVIAQCLQSNCPSAAQVDKAALHIGAIAFIHRFGSSLNGHVHFQVCAVDGVFEEVAGQTDSSISERRLHSWVINARQACRSQGASCDEVLVFIE